ncbi:glyoxylate/hydroxypyruvate reductase HPR3 [Prunus yedoensis var. nudiflora]|uniref:Glyoxylate/hydroxypyruvate reductase HPR3 n=1 Tax=Prunus yedoensis var. nudiflora TaxID=2094558 RepID=A0A314ZFA9_PRUYE|nr:glyoxylate/hydroxypyruvate reductase HPR3 [Prunus yedoensis var. nudiflora]
MDQFQSQDLPQLLIIRPPLSLAIAESQLSQKFHLLKAWESELPLDQFLTTYACSVQAMLCYPFTPVNADLLRLLPALKLVVSPSAGVDNIDLVECRRRGISVTTSGSAFSEDVADTAVGLLIDVHRRISAADRYVKGLWTSKGDLSSWFQGDAS